MMQFCSKFNKDHAPAGKNWKTIMVWASFASGQD